MWLLLLFDVLADDVDGCSAAGRTQAWFKCVECGYENNADVVGAINVLRRGEAMLSSEGQDCVRLACEVNGTVMPSAAGTH